MKYLTGLTTRGPPIGNPAADLYSNKKGAKPEVTSQQFSSLKYGNIIATGGFSGVPLRQWMVLHTNRDDQDNVTAIGVVECFRAQDAPELQLADATPHITVLLNPNLGPTPDILGILKTVPEPK